MMRAQAQKIALLVVIGLVPSAARALFGGHPHKPTVSAVARLKQKAGSREPVFQAVTPRQKGRHAAVEEVHLRGGHAGPKAAAESRRLSRSARKAPKDGRRSATETRRARGRRVAPAPIERRMNAAQNPQLPAGQVEPDDSVPVRHDRKPHAAPEGNAPSPVLSLDLMSRAVSPAGAGDPLLYKRGRLVMPAALRGSHEILLHQNLMADLDGLDRVRDDVALDGMRQSKQLVPIPAVTGIQTDDRLPENRRFCRPWTADFLAELARAHFARFHTRLQVNSAVRTVEFQQQLIHRNGNAAPAAGQTASPHLTGQAVDLAKKGLSPSEIAWMRGYLLPLVEAGKVDVEEEFQQSCFHISVYRKYAALNLPHNQVAEKHAASGGSLEPSLQ